MGVPEANTTLIYGIHIRESANDGSDFSNGATDYRVLFLGEDGLLHVKDSAGTVSNPFSASGAVATDALWDAAGDLAIGTGANTAAKLTVGAANTILSSNGTTLSYAQPRLTFTLGPWVLNDIPGSATSQMGLMYANTTSAMSLSVGTSADTFMGTAGKIVGAILIADAARTGGSAILRPRVAGSATTFNSDGCLIDGTFTTRNSSFVPYANGLAFAATNSIGCALVTSSYTLTTTNMMAWLVVSLDV